MDKEIREPGKTIQDGRGRSNTHLYSFDKFLLRLRRQSRNGSECMVRFGRMEFEGI